MSGMHVTMDAVAREADVSKATVSRALGGSSLIGDEVRGRVEKAARKLGYVRKVVRRPAERGIITVKLVFPPAGNRTARLFYGFSDLVEGLKEGLAPSTANVFVESGGPSFEPFPHKKGGEIDAFIFAFHRPSAGVIAQLKEQGVPMVVLNRVVRGVNHVASDHQAAMATIVKHLAEKGVRGGCCFVGYRGIEDVVGQRLKGFAKACLEEGIRFDDEKDFWLAEGPEEISAEEIAKRARKGVKVWIGVNDVAGSLLLQHLRELGHRVPHEMQVTGCDNAPLRGVSVPLLTTVDLSVEVLAKEAGRALHNELVSGKKMARKLLVEGELLEGQTT